MKVLVTGSSGFVGAALCQALCALGHDVRAFHRPSSNLQMLTGLPVEHAIGDLTQPETLAAAVDGVEVVFHAAALLGGGTFEKEIAVTVAGTRAILQAARQAGVRRVIHTSSVAALGLPTEPLHGEQPQLMNENHSWNITPAIWQYGYAKYMAELEVQRAVADGLDAVIVNPAWVLGPGDIYRLTSSPVVLAAKGRYPILAEGGLNVVHIHDVVDGHLAALAHGERGRRYILGGTNISIASYVQYAHQIAGLTPPTLVLPTGLARWSSVALRPLHALLNLPLDPTLLRLAGNHFYYDTRATRTALGLPEPIPWQQCVDDTYDWFAPLANLPARKSVPDLT